MGEASNFDSINVRTITTPDGNVFIQGQQQSFIAVASVTGTKLTGVLVAPGVLTGAAQLTDLTSLQTKHNAVVDDVTALKTEVQALRDVFVEFQQIASS